MPLFRRAVLATVPFIAIEAPCGLKRHDAQSV